VDRVAQYISDPVVRLRFLKALAPAPQASPRSGWRRPGRLGFLTLAVLVAALALVVIMASVSPSRLRASAPIRKAPAAQPAAPAPITTMPAVADVWLVEKTGKEETYSNGLRIDDHFRVATHRRCYLAFPANGGQPRQRSEAAGMVFHTTESRQAPFEARENGVLKKLGESLLEYVRRKRAYNFLIDRFGRVYRVVAEDEAANHSGYSAWADEKWFYINLNESFLGISFEATSAPAQQHAQISPAQMRSAAMLIEMLRSRYHIPASNCVTHAQVSVNPANMRVGLHVDWASGFPFEELGLPDNYAVALPSLWAYGFDSDSSFSASAWMQAGVKGAAAILARAASDAGLRPAEYKKRLRQRYRERLAQVRRARPDGSEPE
jgi:hypothetical protein